MCVCVRAKQGRTPASKPMSATSGIADRFRNARKSVEPPVPCKDVEDDCVIAPLNMMKPYLKSEAIIRGADTNMADVHSAMVSLIEFMKVPPSEKSSNDPPPPPCTSIVYPHNDSTSGCGCSRVFERIDARNGCIVCDNCGVVKQFNINVEPEFVKPVEESDLAHPSKRARCIRGVNESVVRSIEASDRRDAQKDIDRLILRDMAHWTGYFHLSQHSVYEAAKLFTTWNRSGQCGLSRAAKMLAILYFMEIGDKLPSLASTRKLISRADNPGFDALQMEPSGGAFQCCECARNWSSAKDARFCCRVKVFKGRR